MTIARTPDDSSSTTPVIYVQLDPVALRDTSDWADEEVRERAGKVVTLARDVVDDAVELARSCAIRFGQGLSQLPGNVRPPDDVELQLGITFDSQVGAVIAKAQAGAQIQLTLTWRGP